MSGISLDRLQELHDAETELHEKANQACSAVLAEANNSDRDTLTPTQETQFRQLTKTARRHSCRIELLVQLMQEAILTPDTIP